MFICVCLHRDWFCGLTWWKVYIDIEEFWNAHLLVTEFDCPEVTLCDWQDIKSQLLTSWAVTDGDCNVVFCQRFDRSREEESKDKWFLIQADLYLNIGWWLFCACYTVLVFVTMENVTLLRVRMLKHSFSVPVLEHQTGSQNAISYYDLQPPN